MNFDKISFRTTPEEQEYLERLFLQSGAKNTTDFCHWFLAEHIKWHSHVNIHDSGRQHRDPDSDQKGPESQRAVERDDNTPYIDQIQQIIIREQRMKIKYQDDMIEQLSNALTLQRQQIEQQWLYMGMTPFQPTNGGYDPFATGMSYIEKMATFKRDMSDLL